MRSAGRGALRWLARFGLLGRRAGGARRWPRAQSACRRTRRRALSLFPDPSSSTCSRADAPRSAACASPTCAGSRSTSRSSPARASSSPAPRARPTASSPSPSPTPTGFRHVVRGDRLDERGAARGVRRASSRERDPDVIEGHNIFRFDLEYLEARARRHGVRLAWGRDGSALRGRPVAPADRRAHHRLPALRGRPAATSSTPGCSPSCTTSARATCPRSASRTSRATSAWPPPDRTYVDAAHDHARVRRVARPPHGLRRRRRARDARVGGHPGAALLRAGPARCRSTTSRATLRGAAAKIDALLLREYLRRRPRGPRARAGAAVGGGLHRDLPAGRRAARAARGRHLALSLAHAGRSASRRPRDDARHVPRAARRTCATSACAPSAWPATAAEPAERAHQHALQQSFKILINAFYGYLALRRRPLERLRRRRPGHRRGTRGRHARSSTRLGALGRRRRRGRHRRRLLRAAARPRAPSDDDALLERLAAGLPDGIPLELDGRYAAMLQLQDEDLRAARRARPREPQGLRLPLARPRALPAAAHRGDRAAAAARAAVPSVQDRDRPLARRTSPPTGSRAPVRPNRDAAGDARGLPGARCRRAARSLGRLRARAASGRAWQPGDQISYYVAGRGATWRSTSTRGSRAEWDPARPDENVEYYQAKVLEIWDRFRRFAEQRRAPSAHGRGSGGRARSSRLF